jgi:L-lactate dehydrogenase
MRKFLATMHNVAIVGAGFVGASVAYAAMLRRLPATLHLVDIDQRVVEGQVLDLSDASFLTCTNVRAGTWRDAGDADVIVITAGAKQKPGETRADLLGRNTHILKNIIDSMQPINPHAVMILVSNPVDVLTQVAQQISKLPPNQVFGSGTYLDSMRLRKHLSTLLDIHGNAIHCYVLGEHGDRQFIQWSSAHIGGTPLDKFDHLDKEHVHQTVMKKAYAIIDKKGATYYGIGACVAQILDGVVNDQKDVKCVSCYVERYGVTLSVPAVIGRKGILRVIDVDLSSDEEEKMKVAAVAVGEAVQECAKNF